MGQLPEDSVELSTSTCLPRYGPIGGPLPRTTCLFSGPETGNLFHMHILLYLRTCFVACASIVKHTCSDRQVTKSHTASRTQCLTFHDPVYLASGTFSQQKASKKLVTEMQK